MPSLVHFVMRHFLRFVLSLRLDLPCPQGVESAWPACVARRTNATDIPRSAGTARTRTTVQKKTIGTRPVGLHWGARTQRAESTGERKSVFSEERKILSLSLLTPRQVTDNGSRSTGSRLSRHNEEYGRLPDGNGPVQPAEGAGDRVHVRGELLK